MAFKLPKLTTDVDCEPIGYPGLLVTFWLNIVPDNYEAPEDGQPWETPLYHTLARMIERITFPEGMTDSGEEEVLEIDDKSIYDLLTTPNGFEHAIITWAQSQYQDQRAARLEASAKN